MSNKIISRLTTALVGLLALGAFAISYAALYDTAATHSLMPAYLLWIWPLLVDFALVVFSLAVLRNNLLGERNRWPWFLVGIFTIATTGFNLIHAPATLIGRLVAVIPPLALFLSFETLIAMIKSEIERSQAITSLAELVRQREQLTGDVTALESKTAKLQADLAELKTEKRRAYTDITDETRAAAADILAERSAISGAELGRLLGRSPSTGRRLKRELQPQLSLNGHHSNGKEHLSE